MSERTRIGYVHEFHPNFEDKSWIADQDLTSTDPVVQKEVQHWLYGLANPWSETAVSYVVSPKIAVNEEVARNETWKAEYISTFYDCLQSVAIAYGSTPNEAIDNVTKLVEYVINNYYIHDEDASPSPILDGTMEKYLNLFHNCSNIGNFES